MQTQISDTAIRAIETFYENVAKKYRHTYDYSLMRKNIDEIIGNISKIENGLPRLTPKIKRWVGRGYMARTNGSKQWFFLYIIEGDTIYVLDACHSQNMHESIDSKVSKYIRDYLHSNRMMLSESDTGARLLRLKENQLREMVGYVVRQIINEEYEEVGSVDFELENGEKCKSVVSLRNKGGKQMFHIAKDDGCYVPYSQSLKDGKCKPTYYIFPEMFAAMKKLPKLPLV